ncbi:hypothetical protein A1O7_06871 [Cladophialophora yegresii CBS 114405]|uniref:Uncharacterized protein n=1 Tax=Cladophialophora yegresii CBS 114405 TaxID=1182544 RepID=W9VLE4_9EURO|nr:uncharacterized protein A1O7_06871 [Cladophialophora yegresii CBS 114405]EXJ56527.1 hypothetical protein A1O7_06871 [Cladophialophora yegresii CBS 114405]
MPVNGRLYDYGKWIVDFNGNDHITTVPGILENRTRDVGEVRLPVWIPDPTSDNANEMILNLLLQGVVLDTNDGCSRISARRLEEFGWYAKTKPDRHGRSVMQFKNYHGHVQFQAMWDHKFWGHGRGEWKVKTQGR